MTNKCFGFLFFFVFIMPCIYAQPVTLNADGPGNTYELINSVLAPGYDAVENPECVHPSFGRHIAEVFDADLNMYVFEFYSHVAEDNDRCINFDRERVEIKTYDQSPANMIGTLGETITYKWRFKLATGFKPSSNFTHIHQIKPVNGDDANPLFTLTVRKGTPNKLELIHDNTNKVAIVNLSLFEGQWVEATEIVKVGASGTYSMVIKRLSDNVTILSYSNNNIMTIRPTNSFIRPKWGIYRSLNTPADLRDEAIRFNAFSIEENNVVLPIKLLSFNALLNGSKVDVRWATATETNSKIFTVERSTDAVNYLPVISVDAAGNSNATKNYAVSDTHPTMGKNYYRLKLIDINGSFSYSDIAHVFVKYKKGNEVFIYPNPVKDRISITAIKKTASYSIINTVGQVLLNKNTNASLFTVDVSAQQSGLYFINITATDGTTQRQSFIKQ